jgi:hypothetical protein
LVAAVGMFTSFPLCHCSAARPGVYTKSVFEKGIVVNEIEVVCEKDNCGERLISKMQISHFLSAFIEQGLVNPNVKIILFETSEGDDRWFEITDRCSNCFL